MGSPRIPLLNPTGAVVCLTTHHVPHTDCAFCMASLEETCGASAVECVRNPDPSWRCTGCGCSAERRCPGECFWVAPNRCSRCEVHHAA